LGWLAVAVAVFGPLAVVSRADDAAAAPQQQPAIRTLADVVYTKAGPLELRADVFLPAGEGPFPGVLLVHGGGWALGDKSQMAFLGRRLARRGYVAVSIDYRLAPRYKFPAQLDDCRAALDWMRREAERYHIDPNWLAVFGYSAGGHLAALVGATETDGAAPGASAAGNGRLKAVVAGGAPCDFCHIPANQPILSFWLGGTRAEKPEAYEQASPTRFVSPDDPPTFFYHGDEDLLVPRATSLAMAALLKAAGVPVETYVVRGAGHIRTFFDAAAAEAAIGFLDRQRAAPQR
jgi:acetyl esterase/lipase